MALWQEADVTVSPTERSKQSYDVKLSNEVLEGSGYFGLHQGRYMNIALSKHNTSIDDTNGYDNISLKPVSAIVRNLKIANATRQLNNNNIISSKPVDITGITKNNLITALWENADATIPMDDRIHQPFDVQVALMTMHNEGYFGLHQDRYMNIRLGIMDDMITETSGYDAMSLKPVSEVVKELKESYGMKLSSTKDNDFSITAKTSTSVHGKNCDWPGGYKLTVHGCSRVLECKNGIRSTTTEIFVDDQSLSFKVDAPNNRAVVYFDVSDPTGKYTWHGSLFVVGVYPIAGQTLPPTTLDLTSIVYAPPGPGWAVAPPPLPKKT